MTPPFRIETLDGKPALYSARGLVAVFEAGYGETRKQDAAAVLVMVRAFPGLLDLARLHANQCAEWSARMGGMGEAEEAARYREDERNARAVIAETEGRA